MDLMYVILNALSSNFHAEFNIKTIISIIVIVCVVVPLTIYIGKKGWPEEEDVDDDKKNYL